MTLIVGFAPDDVPMLLGDLLLSGKGQVDPCFQAGHNEIALPSAGITEVRPCFYEGVRVGSLASKIAIINEHLAFAWSGDFERAQRLLSHISREARPGTRDIDDINALFRSASPDDVDTTKLIFLFRSGENQWRLGKKDADKQFDHPVFGNVTCAGSGTTLAVNELCQFQSSQIDLTFAGSDNKTGIALGKAIMAAGHFLAGQACFGAFLDRYFGGAFEIAFLNGGKIQKLDNISFLFWKISDDWCNLELIPLTIKISYIDDILIVKRFEGTLADGRTFSFDRRNHCLQIFCLRPIYSNVDLSKFVQKIDTEMNSDHQCHCIFGQDDNEQIAIYAPLLYGQQDYIKFEWKNDHLEFGVNQVLVDQLGQILANAMSKAAASK